MKRLKTILLFDSSKYIHVVFTQVLFLLSKTSYFAILFLIAELIFLFKKSRNLLIYSLMLMAILNLRLPIYNNARDIDIGTIIDIDDNRVTVENNGKYYLYFHQTHNLQLGMQITFEGERIKADQKNILYGFDYQRFLKANSILGQYNVTTYEVIDQRFVIQLIPAKIKESFNLIYESKISTYLQLFILGDKDNLDKDIVDNSRKIGISHLFAISGMHLSLIIMVLNKILKRFFLNMKTKNIVIGIVLFIYNIITGFLLSVLRASLLSLCLLKSSDNNFSRTDYLSFIMIVFLIYNPYYIFNVGFVLSFLISFSIILGKQIFHSSNNFIQVAKIGLLANLVSLPIIMNMNGSFGIMNILYNVLFVYFVTFILLPGAFLLLIIPLSNIYLLFVDLFEDLIRLTVDLNLYLEFYFSFVWLRYLYYLFFLCFVVFYKHKKKNYFVFGIVFTVFLFVNYYNIIPATFVRILDVNQAEAIHIHHNSCYILIDTGKNDDYDTVIKYFKNNNIKDIDYLVITHMHDDHYGEAIDIINNLKVKTLIVSKTSSEFGLFPQTELDRGGYFGCGDIYLENLNAYQINDENNSSLVLYGKIGIDYWLFTGDIEAKIEEEIVERYRLEVDVLKVAHHGSDTSTKQFFLEMLDSDYAVISVGENYYGHPSDSVLESLREKNIKVFRTDDLGSVTFNYYEIFNIRIIDSYYYDKRRSYYL